MSGFGRPSLGEDPDAFPAGGALGCEHRQAGSDQRHNLPVQFTTFVGRERDATDISRLLLDHRLVSLTGVGGVGKTRLALRVASDLMANQHQGVWFVDLSSLTSAALVVTTLLHTLHIEAIAHQSELEALLDFLRVRDLTLLLIIASISWIPLLSWFQIFCAKLPMYEC